MTRKDTHFRRGLKKYRLKSLFAKKYALVHIMINEIVDCLSHMTDKFILNNHLLKLYGQKSNIISEATNIQNKITYQNMRRK